MKWFGSIAVFLVVSVNPVRGADSPLTPEQRVLSSYRLEAKNKFPEAVDAIMPLYLESRENYFLNLRLGWLFYLQGIYSNSFKHYKAALNAEPEAVAPRQGFIAIYTAEGKWELVTREAEEILASSPGHTQTRQILVRSLIERKNWAAALDKVNAYLKTDPLELTLLEQKARVLRELKRDDLLREHLKEILAVYPLDEYARSLAETIR